MRRAARFRRRRVWASWGSSSRCSSRCSGWAATRRSGSRASRAAVSWGAIAGRRRSASVRYGHTSTQFRLAIAASRHGTMPGAALPWRRTPQCSVHWPVDGQSPPPVPLPVRRHGLRHRLVPPNAPDESYPGIQPTTARNAGDLMTHRVPLGRESDARRVPRPILTLVPSTAGVRSAAPGQSRVQVPAHSGRC